MQMIRPALHNAPGPLSPPKSPPAAFSRPSRA